MTDFLTNPWTITVGGAVIAAIIIGIWRFVFKKPAIAPVMTQNQNVVVNNLIKDAMDLPTQLGVSRSTVNVLFVDDDTRFKIVNILQKNSWIKCQIIKDIQDFSTSEISKADVIFVDIEGVGKTLTPQEQGLGIVIELNKRFPEKHLIIYSSQPVRDMTHPAFKVVKGILRKEAQPSEFLKYIEDARR